MASDRNNKPSATLNGEAATRAREERGGARPASKAERLGSILENYGIVNREDISNLVQGGEESAAAIQQSLVQTGLVREDDILNALAEEMHLERIDFDELNVTKDLVEQVTPKLAKKYRVFPVRYDDDTIHVALSDPLDIQTVDELKMWLGKEVVGCVAPEEDIARNIRRYYEGDEVSQLYEKEVEREDEGNVEFNRGFDYQNVDLDDKSGDEDSGDANVDAVVKFVDMMFRQAVHERASDIHAEPTKRGLDIRFRVDGVLHSVPKPPPRKWMNQIIARLKVLAGLDLAEKRVPQDGRIKLRMEGKHLDLRVSSLPSYYGETIVMRILDQSSVMLGLEDVGFLPDNIKTFNRIIRSPNGVILMTGPTGSGKTTTLYAALGTLNTVDTKIITAEDPVEYQIPGINQVQINREVDLDFSAALRAMLRQSPDIILVGEMRDLETARIGIQAALTGHLVFSTLHTNDAPSATVRLIDMGVKPFLVGSSLQTVIAQRLVRRICPACKEAYKPDPAELVELDKDPEADGDVQFYRGKGCERCNEFGYRGRTAIHEIMEMNPDLRRMVIREEAANRIKNAAVEFGMRSLRGDGYEKILLGQTTFEEVVRMTADD